MRIDVAPADQDLLKRAVRRFMGTTASTTYAGSAGALAFVAIVDDEVVGWCWGYHLVRPDSFSMLYLHQLEVAVPHRRQGIGRRLLRTFMRAGTESGATKMFLTTATDNPARTLYDAEGGGPASQGATTNYWFLLDG